MGGLKSTTGMARTKRAAGTNLITPKDAGRDLNRRGPSVRSCCVPVAYGWLPRKRVGVTAPALSQSAGIGRRDSSSE